MKHDTSMGHLQASREHSWSISAYEAGAPEPDPVFDCPKWPDARFVQLLVDYDPDTGELTWRARQAWMYEHVTANRREGLAASFNRRYPGRPAIKSLMNVGYYTGSIFSHRVTAHRVAWAHYYGEWPSGDIDHINGIKTDNRIINLRDVPHCVNQRNCKLQRNNTSGYPGISRTRHGTWHAYAKVNGRRHSFGSHKTIEAALKARADFIKHHNFHPNHGRKD